MLITVVAVVEEVAVVEVDEAKDEETTKTERRNLPE
jgi:hypothetical protein